MQRVISLIIARDENKQPILMNIEVGEGFGIENINIGGYLFTDQERDSLSKKLIIQKELFDELKDNEPLDITYRFENMTASQILKTLSA
ncbi:MAG: hypothetical protein PHO62_10945 [Sulfurimonas sp.]|uniref:hypothetical protein n=1 Tax=Sulfurimonas sp. TaxID=2022749 RepID=UPI0026058B4F|nr:hypothetical protein [Sulfurimonas sp.]MDD5373927.1 hypothetical protein [Sulfurimonas sp.]